jgi:DNA-binding MarR family transcriptional regulator
MEVIARISRLCRILERRLEAVYSEYGLNQAQFGVLAALRRAGPPYCLSPTALYNSLLISSGAMTNRLDRLTAAGYVRRVPDASDGRSLLVALTPEGKRLIDRLLVDHYENEHRLLATLSPDDRKMLASMLRRLLIDFEEDLLPGAGRSNNVSKDVPTERSSRRLRARSAR